MLEGTDSVFNIEPVLKNFFQILQNLVIFENSYCDHRNFDDVNPP